MTQRTYFKLGVYSILLIAVVIFYLWWLSFNASRYRDYERLGDMRVLQAVLADYYGKFNTYNIPQCIIGSTINVCLGNDSMPLAVSSFKDPLNSDSYRYIVSSLSDNDFQIDFYFEKNIAGFPLGHHSLTKNGIR